MSSARSCFKTTELSVEIPEVELWRDEQREQKDKLARRLESEGDFATAQMLDSCGVEMMLVCSECNSKKHGWTACKKRYCPCCAPKISAERVTKFECAVLKMKWPMHVTLTVRNTADITTAHLVRLMKSFRKLRQRVLWKRTVKGGFASLEIVNSGNGWHPHLHIIADCEWLSLTTAPPAQRMARKKKFELYQQASAELEKEWSSIVNQKTSSVKVRRKYGLEGARYLAKETMKYAVKPADLLECKERARDVVAAMKSVRMFRPFGNCHKLKLDDVVRAPCQCEECGLTGTFVPDHVLEQREKNAEWKLHKSTRKRRR